MIENYATISLCMIIKDEEDNLAQSLKALKNIVHEIIIVDVGASDSTIEIARQNKAKIFNYIWQNDYAAARNFALKQASCEWILNLDADHLFHQDIDTNLNFFLNETKHLAFMIEQRTFEDHEKYHPLDRLLLFKNHLGFYYSGVIHEHPGDSIFNYARKKIYKDPIGRLDFCWIDHFGLQDPVKFLNRDLPILKNAIKKNPDDYHYRFKLLLTLKNLDLREDYKSTLLATIYRIENTNPELTESIVGIWGEFGEWVIQDNNEDAHEQFYKAAKLINTKTKYGDVRVVWPYVKLSIRQKNYQKAIEDLTRCIKNGIAPRHISMSQEERIVPVYQLIKLIDSTKTANELADFLQNINVLLAHTDLSENAVLNFIKKHDFKLFEQVFGKDKVLLDESLSQSPNTEDYITRSSEDTPFISLCMIVKNEQDNLDRCLKSVKSIVDEIIIVDTGSDDRSPIIANSYGAKIIFKSWNDDFSDARNTALSAAKGKWIMHLDADEEIDNTFSSNLKKFLEDTPADGIDIIVRNFQPKGDIAPYIDEQQVRIFKNKSNHIYQNKIHEQIVPSIAQNGGIFSQYDLIINHYGYQKNNDKRAYRNLSLLSNQLENDPHDAYTLFKIGETYKALHEWEKAKEYLSQAISNPSGNIGNEIKELIYLRLGQIELALDNYEDAKKYASACLRFNSKNAMAKYVMGIAMLYLGEAEKAFRILTELRATQAIHGLDLTDIDHLLEMFSEVDAQDLLN